MNENELNLQLIKSISTILCQSNNDGVALEDIVLTGYSADQIKEHVKIAQECDLIFDYCNIKGVWKKHLTIEGHELLAIMNHARTWSLVKQRIGEEKTSELSAINKLAQEVAVSEVSRWPADEKLSKNDALNLVDGITGLPDKGRWRWVIRNQDKIVWVRLGDESTNVQIDYDGYTEDFERDNGTDDLLEGTCFYLECIGCSEGVTILLDAIGIKWIC